MNNILSRSLSLYIYIYICIIVNKQKKTRYMKTGTTTPAAACLSRTTLGPSISIDIYVFNLSISGEQYLPDIQQRVLIMFRWSSCPRDVNHTSPTCLKHIRNNLFHTFHFFVSACRADSLRLRTRDAHKRLLDCAWVATSAASYLRLRSPIPRTCQCWCAAACPICPGPPHLVTAVLAEETVF